MEDMRILLCHSFHGRYGLCPPLPLLIPFARLSLTTSGSREEDGGNREDRHHQESSVVCFQSSITYGPSVTSGKTLREHSGKDLENLYLLFIEYLRPWPSIVRSILGHIRSPFPWWANRSPAEHPVPEIENQSRVDSEVAVELGSRETAPQADSPSGTEVFYTWHLWPFPPRLSGLPAGQNLPKAFGGDRWLAHPGSQDVPGTHSMLSHPFQGVESPCPRHHGRRASADLQNGIIFLHQFRFLVLGKDPVQDCCGDLPVISGRSRVSWSSNFSIWRIFILLKYRLTISTIPSN